MNNTTITDVTIEAVSNTERYIIITIIFIITLLVFLSNIVIAAVLLDSSKLPTNTRYLTGSLCVSDLGVGILLGFSLVTGFSNRWIFGDAVCVMIMYGTCDVLAVSLMTLTVMMIDKTLLVNFPLRYQSVMTRKLLTLCVITIWIVSLFLVYVIAKVTHFHYKYEHEIFLCAVDFQTIKDSRNALIITFVAGLFPIFGIFLFGNLSIYRISQYHHRRNLQNAEQINSVGFNGSFETTNIKGLMTILLSTVIRVICWFPIFALGIINWSSGVDVHRSFRLISQLLIYCNSFGSWLIYTTTHVTYREAQKKLFTKMRRKISRLKTASWKVSPLHNSTIEVIEL